MGWFGARAGLQSVDDCTSCPPGSFCSLTALVAPNGNCSAGFFCPEGSQNQYGLTIAASNNTCPTGFYCPAGSGTPQPCVPGTYNPRTGISALSDCMACLSGYYCSSYNLVAPVGPCPSGYFCGNGSTMVRMIFNTTYYCESLKSSLHRAPHVQQEHTVRQVQLLRCLVRVALTRILRHHHRVIHVPVAFSVPEVLPTTILRHTFAPWGISVRMEPVIVLNSLVPQARSTTRRMVDHSQTARSLLGAIM